MEGRWSGTCRDGFLITAGHRDFLYEYQHRYFSAPIFLGLGAFIHLALPDSPLLVPLV